MGTVYAKEVGMGSPSPMAMGSKPRIVTKKKEVVLSEVPAKVEKIHIDGLQRTKNDIVTKHVKDIFSASDFEDMVKRTQQAKASLEKLGLFRKINITIDVSKGPEARKDGYEIVYKVQEHRKMTGGISTLFGTNEGSLLFQINCPNTFGRGEKISTEYQYGTKKAMGFGLSFSKPLQGDPNLGLQATLFQHCAEYPWSGYRENEKGISTDFTFPTLLGSHQLRWEGVWRELSCLSNTTAFAVREQAGHSLKSSLKHIWMRDQRDDKVIPNSGYLIKLTQELAGLGGDADFVKNELELQFNQTLFWDSVLQLSLAGGMMKSIRPGSELKIQDRLFLGGPLTLRGFNLKGVGPHEDGCAVGADTYWLTGLHLYTPLPFRPGRGGFGDLFRTHFFLNAGNLRNINLNDEWKLNMRKLAESMRMSYGLGIVLRMGGIARMELNYCWPIRAHRGDSISEGVQFGIGIHFL